MQIIKNVKFIKSILNWQESPEPALPEIAFVGRSNVGKSSLINCLVNIKNFARVSKQPGKTQTLNYFSVNNLFYLVDLPGYGYAKSSKAQKKEWQKAIESYLLNSPNLRMLLVLVDGKVGAKSNDVQLAEWLDYNQIPYRIIATKIDKVSKNARQKQRKLIVEQLQIDKASPVIMTSSKDKTGQEAIVELIDQILQLSG